MKSDNERKLAAIMFTDMVGYSALTQEDEALALELLEEHRQILRPFFPKHGGREVETAGDAFFVEFSSALEAVKCAIDIQKELWERNKNVSKERHLIIRIGIHLGDVVHKGANVLGDGVNIAARIEPLAQSGGVCVSEDVARQVQNKIELALKIVETRKLKNIKIPVDVYAVVLDWLEEIPDTQPARKRKKIVFYLLTFISISLFILIGIKLATWYFSEKSDQFDSSEWENSIAVLPFTDMSPEKDQEYFCDGMTEQILTNLAKLNRLKVIARTSVMKFKDTHKTIPEIGEELNVKNILEGSVRKSGNRLRVTAQLVKSDDGSHIWAEDYDREYGELFAIQDDISRSIADKLSEKLSVKEVDVIKTNRTVNLEAYEYFLRGEYLHRNEFWSTSSTKDFKNSEQMFLKSIELDPEYAPAYAGLVDLYNTYWNTPELGAEEKQIYLDLQEKYISIAFDLDSMSADVNRVMGWVYGAKNDTDNEIESMKKAVRLDANDPENIRSLGICYDIIGLKNLAFKCYTRCIDLDPFNAKNYYYLANVHIHLGRLERAKSDFQRALKLEPNDPKFLFFYIWLLIQMGEYTEAEDLYSKYDYLNSDTDDNRFLKALFYATDDKIENALNLDLGIDNKNMLYLFLKMDEEVIRYWEENLEQVKKSEKSKYLALENHPLYDFLRPDPRFQEILEEHKIIYEANLARYGDIDL